MKRTAMAALIGALAACGGAKQTDTTRVVPGTTHADEQVDLDVVPPPGDGAAATPDAGLGADAEVPAAPVTFVLKNTAEEDLVLNMDRGWQPILFAYSGTPPKAKAILMFPTHCTAACDASETDRCPVCEEPEKVVDVKKAQQLQHIAPGQELEVPWDLRIYPQERTRGKNSKGRKVRCNCYREAEAPPETYTVKACGLRLTHTAEQSSKYQCVEGTMTLPVEAPVRVELEFPAPASR